MAGSKQDVFPFFVGCGRSGTTLIRVIFNAHPRIAVPRESHFIPSLAAERARCETPSGIDADAFIEVLERSAYSSRWALPPRKVRRALRDEPDLAGAIRALYALYAETKGKELYGDKTPNYATHLPLLASLLPESRFVHVIRDGRDVALSFMDVSFGPRTLDEAALYWRHQVATAREAGHALGRQRYMEYRHEDLVAEPEQTLRGICGFLDLEFDERMLRYHEERKPAKREMSRHLNKPPTAGLRDFRAQMTPVDVRAFELLAGDLLADLGYGTAAETLPARAEREAGRRAAAARRVRALRTSRLAGLIRSSRPLQAMLHRRG